MGYKPIYDLSVDIVLDSENTLEEMLDSIMHYKLVLTKYGRTPNGDTDITVRGSAMQITAWVNDYYDEGLTNTLTEQQLTAIEQGNSPAEQWVLIMQAMADQLKQVA